MKTKALALRIGVKRSLYKCNI